MAKDKSEKNVNQDLVKNIDLEQDIDLLAEALSDCIAFEKKGKRTKYVPVEYK